MVEYVEKFAPFGIGQGLPDNKILKLVGFLLPRQWKILLIIQGFNYATHGVTETIEFFERLETVEEIFHTQGEENHQNKNQ